MNENISNTSLEAWNSIQIDMNHRQEQVYKTIQDHPMVSDKEIAFFADLPINQVTPRRGELFKMGKVIFAGYKKDPQTGRRTKIWFAPLQS